jgi:hypothetical protein
MESVKTRNRKNLFDIFYDEELLKLHRRCEIKGDADLARQFEIELKKRGLGFTPRAESKIATRHRSLLL